MNLYRLVRMSVKKEMKAELEMSCASCGTHVSAKVFLVNPLPPPLPSPSPPASFPPSFPQVVMSQRLGSSLRRKVSETETQLLALHEAKLAAISGSAAPHLFPSFTPPNPPFRHVKDAKWAAGGKV